MRQHTDQLDQLKALLFDDPKSEDICLSSMDLDESVPKRQSLHKSSYILERIQDNLLSDLKTLNKKAAQLLIQTHKDHKTVGLDIKHPIYSPKTTYYQLYYIVKWIRAERDGFCDNSDLVSMLIIYLTVTDCMMKYHQVMIEIELS